MGPPGPVGERGPAGVDGLNCWDIDGDHVADPGEDVNGDGLFTALDCRVSPDLSSILDRLEAIEQRLANSDFDNDGFSPATGDCDDSDFSVNPSAGDQAGDGIDSNCDGVDGIDDGGAGTDFDGDGFSVADGDCDDNNPSINPGAPEICGDSIDNNCDSRVDENCAVDPICGDGIVDLTSGEECDDGNFVSGDGCEPDCTITPMGACVDGEIRSCYSGPAGTTGIGVCTAGTETCTNGEFGACEGQVLPSEEICDGLDNDCDGEVDEGIETPVVNGSRVCSGGELVLVCDAGFGDCDGSVANGCESDLTGGPGGFCVECGAECPSGTVCDLAAQICVDL